MALVFSCRKHHRDDEPETVALKQFSCQDRFLLKMLTEVLGYDDKLSSMVNIEQQEKHASAATTWLGNMNAMRFSFHCFAVRHSFLSNTVVTLAPSGLAHHRLNSTVPPGDSLARAEGQRKWQAVATATPPSATPSHFPSRFLSATSGQGFSGRRLKPGNSCGQRETRPLVQTFATDNPAPARGGGIQAVASERRKA